MGSIFFTNVEERQAYGNELKLFLPEMGDLQKQLYEGEYDPFKYVPLFESNFVQVTKRGEVVDIHNQVTLVTLGIAATSPILPLPNVMLLARPLCDPCNYETSYPDTLQLSRLFPLKFVKITINDIAQRQLKLKLANGRTFYLQLYAPSGKADELFERWMKLIYLLRPPQESGADYSYESRPTSASTMEHGYQTKMIQSSEKQEILEELSLIKEEEVSPGKTRKSRSRSPESPKRKESSESEIKPAGQISKKSSDTKKPSIKKDVKRKSSKVNQKESKLSNLFRNLSKHSSSDTVRKSSSDTVRKSSSDSVKQSSSTMVKQSSSATVQPSSSATVQPSSSATVQPSSSATVQPSSSATVHPSSSATVQPSSSATVQPSSSTTMRPSSSTTMQPSSSTTVQQSSSMTVQLSSSAMVQPSSSDTVKQSSSDTVKQSSSEKLSKHSSPEKPSKHSSSEMGKHSSSELAKSTGKKERETSKRKKK